VEQHDLPSSKKKRTFASAANLGKYVKKIHRFFFGKETPSKEERRRPSGPKVGPTM
jgi:hypothetical protein